MFYYKKEREKQNRLVTELYYHIKHLILHSPLWMLIVTFKTYGQKAPPPPVCFVLLLVSKFKSQKAKSYLGWGGGGEERERRYVLSVIVRMWTNKQTNN